MMETSWTISLSLVVASLTLSHVTAIVLSVEEADDTSWSSMVEEHDVDKGSSQRMPAREERPKGSSGCVTIESLVAATSSGNVSMSGFMGPVGWRDTASATLCFSARDVYHSESIA